MVEVYSCKLPASRQDTVIEKLFFQIPQVRQNRLKRFVKIDDTYRSLIGDLLVRFAFQKRYGSIDEELKITTNDYGKPSLSEYPSFHYNISHSGEYVVCVVHDDAVGVDIEYIRPFDLRLAKELFTEEEYQEVLANEDSLAAFYDIWTLKESYIKAVGQGLAKPLKGFSMKKYTNENIQITNMETKRQVSDYVCRQYKVEGYRFSVCAYLANVDQFSSQPLSVTFQELCESLNFEGVTDMGKDG